MKTLSTHPNRRLARLLRLAAFVAALCAAGPAHALLCTLGCSCAVTTTPLVFGPYNPLLATNNDSTGNVRVTCGGGVGVGIGYTVALGPGGSTTIAARSMSGGATRLAYNLYTSNTYATVWGDPSGGAMPSGSVVLDVLGSAQQDFTVYGRMPGSQVNVAPGAYSDAVVVTVTYF